MVTIRGGSKLEEALRSLSAKVQKATKVEVGFMGGATEKDGTLVAAVAAFNEFGTEHIPPRPFMRNTVAKNSSKWPINLATALKATDYDAKKSLGLVGQEIQEEIQEQIRSNTPPPNAPSTVAQKGFDRTLIDTSTMLNSVTHKVT